MFDRSATLNIDKLIIKADQADSQNLCNTCCVCVDTSNYASHPDGALLNIVTGTSR